MKYRWVIFILLIIAGSAVAKISAQDIQSDMEFIIANNPIKEEVKKENGGDKELVYRSDPAFAFLLFIRTYQILISSQQSSNVCVFYPSCSHFGQLSIKEFGFFKGGLMTSDRLQRCHVLSTEYYQPYQNGLKLHDPVEHYQLNLPCSEHH